MTSPYAKAIVAALIALFGGLSVAVVDGLTLVEALGVAGLVVTAAGGVFAVPNEPLPAPGE